MMKQEYGKFIIEGVRYENDKFIFDFKNDNKDDIIYLKTKSYNKKFSKVKDFSIFYGYKYGSDFKNQEIKNKFLLQLKNLKFKQIDNLINKAIFNLNKLIKIESFDIIITPKSSSPLTNYIGNKFREKTFNSVFTDNIFIKNTIDNIKIDKEKISKLSDKDKKQFYKNFEKSIETGTFQLKKLTPIQRRLIYNFLKFNSETERKIYNLIYNGNVLVIDDILTTNTTIVEINKQLLKFNPNKVQNFVLITK